MTRLRILTSAIILIAIAGLFTAFLLGSTTSPHATSYKKVEINSHTINVEVVDTVEERQKGLSGRDSLEDDSGMLFIFDEEDFYSFWMRDMNFSIDIVWISGDGHVVDMHQNVSPETYPQTFSSKKPARYVLELPAHVVKRYKINLGDIVRL
jgi:uncharacterized protein